MSVLAGRGAVSAGRISSCDLVSPAVGEPTGCKDICPVEECAREGASRMVGEMECTREEGDHAQCAQRHRPARLPTEGEIWLHSVTHLLLRNRSEECVAARGRDWPPDMRL